MKNVEKFDGQRIDLTNKFALEADIEKALGDGEVEVVVSNSGIDRHGESILVNGIDLDQIKRNPVVLWAHDYMGLPIGTITKLWKSGGDLKARIKFAIDVYGFARTVYEMVKQGFINAVSIGGIVKKWNQDYSIIEKMEMVELSVVPVGAHPDALVIARSLGIEEKDVREQYQDFVQKTLLDKMGKMPQDNIKLYIEALKKLTSALESTYDSTDSENTQEQVKIKRLITVRQTVKQIDKTSELIIRAINDKLN